MKKITQNGISFEYAYDTRGNIVSEKRGNLTTTYSYDALGQLIRVNDPHENATWVYNYDRGGNITSKVKYAYTTGVLESTVETIPYTYGDTNWKDKLTAYNGTAITYDAIGNPLNDGIWTYEWSVGRQLKKMSREGQSLTFKYNHNGMRMQKIVEAGSHSETANYYLCGKLLTHMSVDCRDASEAAHQDVMHFFYDAQSRPAKVSFNGTIYTYIHNFQGDVVGLLDNSGTLVVEYKYDAWGKLLATTGSLAATLGKRNPFRYRGYIYDEETGLYYLRNRYYSPAIGRFLIADLDLGDQKELLHHNGFTYCRNAPILFVDMDGFGCFLAGIAIIGAVIGVATQLVSNLINGEDWKNNLVGAAVGGAVFNVVATTTGSIAAASYASAAAESATNEAVSYLTGKKNFTADNLKDSALNIAVDTALNGSVYVITGRIANRLHPINDKWFKPQKSLKIVFTGKYGIHVWKQTGWQGFYNAVWNGYRGFWEPAFRMDQ